MLELNRMVSYLKNHAEEFAELLAQKTTKDHERESRNRRQRLQELIVRNKEVDRLFERIYEYTIREDILVALDYDGTAYPPLEAAARSFRRGPVTRKAATNMRTDWKTV